MRPPAVTKARHVPRELLIAVAAKLEYNRAGVERVMGFCTEEQAKGFLQAVPPVEKTIRTRA
jgi:polyphosphate kinase